MASCECKMKVNRGAEINDELFKACHCSSGCGFCATHNQLPGKTWTFRPDAIGEDELKEKTMAIIGAASSGGTCADSIQKRLQAAGKTTTVQKVTAVLKKLHDAKLIEIVPDCGFSGPAFYRVRMEEWK